MIGCPLPAHVGQSFCLSSGGVGSSLLHTGTVSCCEAEWPTLQLVAHGLLIEVAPPVVGQRALGCPGFSSCCRWAHMVHGLQLLRGTEQWGPPGLGF